VKLRNIFKKNIWITLQNLKLIFRFHLCKGGREKGHLEFIEEEDLSAKIVTEFVSGLA
jgi:hypothetical protein